MSDPLRIDSWNSEGIRFSRRLTNAQLDQLADEASRLFPDGWLARVDAAGPTDEENYQACRDDLERWLVGLFETTGRRTDNSRSCARETVTAIERTILARLVLMGAIPPA